MDTDAVLRMSAAALAAALREKRFSSSELTDAFIDRIEKVDPAINAVVVRDFERARDAAKAADEALERGEFTPLLGVPMTVKEAHNVSGLATTWGNPESRNRIAERDSVAVARLRAAGAIILGKTNVPVGLGDWQSFNPIYGRTCNPHDLSRTPGGSSGGSAAALAAFMTPLELGSDFAGSIRVPSAFCGVFGHKPSYGLIPTRGFGSADGPAMPMAVIGPMARTASDLSLALDILAGPDTPEAVAWRLDLPPPRHMRIKDYRVILLDSHPGAPTDTGIQAALHHLEVQLQARGACVLRAENYRSELAGTQACFINLMMCVKRRDRRAVRLGEYFEALGAQANVRRRWANIFKSADLVLAPAFGTVAFPHTENADMNQRTLVINGEDTRYLDQTAWPSLASVAHLPSTVVPVGCMDPGLPIGIQIIGPFLHDRTTIGFAELLEHELETVHMRWPTLPMW